MQRTYRDIWCLFARKTKSGFTFQNDNDYICILLHVYGQIIYIFSPVIYEDAYVNKDVIFFLQFVMVNLIQSVMFLDNF